MPIEIEEIRLKPAAGEASRVEKANGTWQLIEPEKTEADQGQVSNAATSLAALEINSVVDENPSDLAQYGLNPAKVDVAFRVKGQKDERHLLLGEKTATGGDLYAKTPDQKRVFLVASYHGPRPAGQPLRLLRRAAGRLPHRRGRAGRPGQGGRRGARRHAAGQPGPGRGRADPGRQDGPRADPAGGRCATSSAATT